MKILMLHNRYQHRAGEDQVHDAKRNLLVSKGEDVQEVILDNAQIRSGSALLVGIETSWSRSGYDRILNAINSWRPDILDVDNFFPLASPSIYYAAWRSGVPVVQTLHNYRLLCPGATLFRDNRVCEDCVGKKVPWRGVVHGCYRNSRPATLAVAAMLTLHNSLATWNKKITLFVALTDFCRRQFITGGLPPRKIVVRPNFVPHDMGIGAGDGNFVLFVGRLSADKGITLLMEAWKLASDAPGLGRLIIAGDGPERTAVRQAAETSSSIEYLGQRPGPEILELMGHARALVFPSLWYEGMPSVITEALSRGTPVVSNRIGSMTEMIQNGTTGWLVEPGDRDALAGAMLSALRNPETRMRAAAREEFETNYTAERSYDLTMRTFQQAIDLNKQREGKPS
jgi:glycosyltransferase involved in cell wall biosynthesis